MRKNISAMLSVACATKADTKEVMERKQKESSFFTVLLVACAAKADAKGEKKKNKLREKKQVQVGLN